MGDLVGGCEPWALACVRVFVDSLTLFIQLAPARIGKLVPGFRHLLELLAVSRWGSARHVSAFGGVLLILVDLLHDETVSRLRKILMSRVRTEKQRDTVGNKWLRLKSNSSP
jgi:hypothetical protein